MQIVLWELSFPKHFFGWPLIWLTNPKVLSWILIVWVCVHAGLQSIFFYWQHRDYELMKRSEFIGSGAPSNVRFWGNPVCATFDAVEKRNRLSSLTCLSHCHHTHHHHYSPVTRRNIQPHFYCTNWITSKESSRNNSVSNMKTWPSGFPHKNDKKCW